MKKSDSKFNKTLKENKLPISELDLLKDGQGIGRALTAQRLFGQLIIREDNEGDLLNNICKISVEVIGYKLAWIGFAMEDKTVKPVASAGFSKDYLDKIKITWSNDKFSEGPTGQAIKTGNSIVMQDILNNPKFLPWREPAIIKGFKTSVAIPLIYDSKVFGAFNIYSEEKDVFNKEELNILQLAANDLAIGISNIRRKKEIQLKTIELQKAKEKAEENEKKYKTIFNQASLGVALVNSHTGNISEVNSKFAEIIGRTIEEVTNIDWMSITHPDDIQKDLDNMAQMNAGKIDGFQMEKRYMKPDGSYVWIHMTIAPVKEENTVVKRHLCMIEDITNRKQYEIDIQNKNEALKLSNEELFSAEERFRTFTEASKVAVFVIKDRNFWYVNKECEEILEYTREELQEIDFVKVLHPDYIKLVSENNQKRIEGNYVNPRYEIKMISKLGKTKDIDMNVAMIDLKGEPAVLISASDITERKQTEKEVISTKARLEHLLAESSVIIYSSNATPPFGATYISENAKDIVGFEPSDFLNDAGFWANQIHPDDTAKVFEELPKVFKFGHHTHEYRWKKKDGKYIWLSDELRLVYDEQGNPIEMVGAWMDISERKRAEQLQKVLYNISNSVITSDNLKKLISLIQKELGTIIDTSNFYVALYDHLTDTFSIPFFADEKKKVSSIPKGKTLTNYVIKTKKSLLANDEKMKELEQAGTIDRLGSKTKNWLGVPLKIQGEIIGVLAVRSYTDENAYDNSDLELLEFVSDQISLSIHRKKSEEDLIKALGKAKESDRLKSAFLANMSHEIRTPMNGILGFSGLLKTPDLTDDKQQKYIEIIEKSGARMLNTINDLMDISKIESGQMEIYISEVNIKELIKELYEFFKLEAEKKGIQFSIKNTLIEKEVIIKSDREKIYAILANLVKNAIKYTRKGGIEFGCCKKGNNLEFFVKDSGIGIPNNRHQAIFNRFVQADIEDREAYEGSGLGLSISKAYVEMLGGEIWVESEVGYLPAAKVLGSKFYFTIPYNAKTEEKTSFKVSVLKDMDESQKLGLKILIVDDEETAKIYLGALLKNLSKEIIYADNGLEAVELCKKNPDINLILMDIKMPIINGYEATKQIREFNKDVIIIIQTAFALSGDKEKALEAGGNDYISKPIKEEELMRIIRNYFKQ